MNANRLRAELRRHFPYVDLNCAELIGTDLTVFPPLAADENDRLYHEDSPYARGMCQHCRTLGQSLDSEGLCPRCSYYAEARGR